LTEFLELNLSANNFVKKEKQVSLAAKSPAAILGA
jgi:hypothetical protein